MGDTVLFRSAHNTYLSFQGISIKTLPNADKSCYFQLERYGHDQVAIRTPQGYYVGIASNRDVYVSDSVNEAQMFTLMLFENGKKAFCNMLSKIYIGVDHAGNVRGFTNLEEGALFEEIPVHNPPLPRQVFTAPLAKQGSATEQPVQSQQTEYVPAPTPQKKTVYVQQPPPPSPEEPVHVPVAAAAPAPSPAPAPVYIQQPAPVYIQQQPQPAPIYIQQEPARAAPAPRGSAAVPLMGGFIVGNALGRRRRR